MAAGQAGAVDSREAAPPENGKSMMKLTEEFKENISEAVLRYELKTSGEIVPVLLKASDHYSSAHYRAGLILGVLGHFLAYAFDLNFSLPFFPLYCFVAFFTVGFLSANIGVIKRLMTLKSEFDEEVRKRATELFYELGLHSTKDRNGVLIFLSLVERRIIIMADKGIHEKVGQVFWDKIVTKMIPLLKSKQVLEALALGIANVGNALTHHFPRHAADSKELANELYVR